MVNSSSQQNGTQNESTLQWLSSSECIAWLTVFMAQSVAIVTLNILTIIVFIKNSGLRKRSMYLVINLAVADLFFGGFVEVMDFFNDGVYCNFWQYNLSYVGLWENVIYAVYHTFVLTSIINLAALSLERLHATFRPFKHRIIKKWVFRGAVALIWVTAGLYSIAFEVTRKLGHLFNYLVVSFYSFVSICLFFIFVSYMSIAVKINCGARPQPHDAVSREKKLTKTLFIMTVVSLMLWLPLVVFLYFYRLGDSSVTSLSPSTYFHLRKAFLFLYYANSLVNPILYAFRMPEFKKALVSLLRCRSQPAALQDFPLDVM